MLVALIVLDHTYWKLNSFCLIFKWSEIVQINESCAYSMLMLIQTKASPLLNHHVCCGLPELITLTYCGLFMAGGVMWYKSHGTSNQWHGHWLANVYLNFVLCMAVVIIWACVQFSCPSARQLFLSVTRCFASTMFWCLFMLHLYLK